MRMRQARILVVDDPEHTLSAALDGALARHQVDVAKDPVDTLYRIDCASPPYDVVFCDVARGDLPGPELWAYLWNGRKGAAERIVFIASTPLAAEVRAFLDRVPNPCVWLPTDPEVLDALVNRRAISSSPIRIPSSDADPPLLETAT
jgi:hypothetical protein